MGDGSSGAGGQVAGGGELTESSGTSPHHPSPITHHPDATHHPLTDADIKRLRQINTLDQQRAAHADRTRTAREDADVVAAYYKRLKERGVPPAHALTLTEGWQMLNREPFAVEDT